MLALPISGTFSILLAGVGLSFGGLIVRNCPVASDWQIIFYRSTVVALVLLLLMAWRSQKTITQSLLHIGWPGLCAGLLIGMSMVTFVLSINATSVANTLFVLAASPFLAAVLSWMLMRERVARSTLVAMIVALFGVGIMVWSGMTEGRLYGNLMGLITSLGFAGFTVALRFGREADMTPSVCIAGTVSATISACVVLSSGSSFVIPAIEMGLCTLWGVLIACCFALWVFGGRIVPAAVLAMLSLTEVLLGPVWVWLFLQEVPDVMTLFGGALLFGAIFGQAFTSIRQKE